MKEQEPVRAFDWQRMLIHDFPWTYLGEVALRTVIMFLIILTALKISGKRQVKQLSVYELVLVIGLGSAAGDPMFYHDVPLSSAFVVFVVMMICYKLATRLSDKSTVIQEALEGKPVYVIQDGCILTRNFDEEDLGRDELFSELRLAGVEHLGQVKTAILEPNGELSVFQFEPDRIVYGLPIMPDQLKDSHRVLPRAGRYACCNCGHVKELPGGTGATCERCDGDKWVPAQN